MNFLNLKYFLVLAEELNFTQAAEKLHISQQSLSAHIIRIEKECGLQLIKREPPLSLTTAGEEFAKSASIILKEKEFLEKKMTVLRDSQQSTISIGVPGSRSTILMPRVLSLFHQEYPNVKIRLIEGTTDEIFKDLLKGKVDLILGFEPANLNDQLECRKIYMETTKIIVPNEILDTIPNKDLLLASDEPVPVSAFASCPFVSLHESTLTGNMLHMVAKEENFVPNIIVETKNLMTMLSLCYAGLGVCICPNSFLIDIDFRISPIYSQKATIFSMKSDYGQSWITVTRPKRNYLSEPEKKLLNIIKKTYSNVDV